MERRHRDLAIAGVFLGGGVLMNYAGTYRGIFGNPDAPVWPYLIPLTVASVALLWRRTRPILNLAIGTLALAADLTLGGSLPTILVYTQVTYDACGYGPPWLWRWLLRISGVLTGVAAVVGLIATRDWRGLGLAIPIALGLLMPVLTGISVRQYRDQAEEARARAEVDRRRAVAEERNRMARDLHDVIANHLSAVAIHATAALSAGAATPEVTRSLGMIRENSVQGLAEMRRMVGLLRDGGVDAATAPPRLSELDGLLDGETLTATGAQRTLPAAVDLAAYRIVQESVTNARKHGAGPAVVVLHYFSGYLSIEVDNPLAASGADVPGAGVGLIGMRERAELLGGTFTAGAVDGVWRVRAELPT